MPAVFLSWPLERLGRIVGVHILRRTKDDRSGVYVQVDVVGEMDAAAQISAGRNPDRAAAGLCRRADGSVYGRIIQSDALARRTVIAGIEESFTGNRICLCGCGSEDSGSYCNESDFQKIQ